MVLVRRIFTVTLFLSLGFQGLSQGSVARQWNEVLLEAIRNDFARPNVHARNLFHTAVLMYDCWAAYDTVSTTYFLGKEIHGFPIPFNGVDKPTNPLTLKRYREEALSYAVYRLLTHRFEDSPGASHSLFLMDSLFAELGYDKNFFSWNYSSGSPAALGNYIAAYMINFGLQDGSNEINDYTYRYYDPVNPPLDLEFSGNPDLIDPNRWQPLKFDTFVDQSGNLILGGTPEFLGPEWGKVEPFSLKDHEITTYERDSTDYWVYHDPGPPPLIDTSDGSGTSAYYQWGFSLVSAWTAHLDPADTTMWDISPNNIGNIELDDMPDQWEDYPDFYDFEKGGDLGQGYALNPHTGEPYEPQMKRLGDYARVLAEFWADGPDSETPPGHWHTILNTVMDYPEFKRKFKGEGEELDVLEYEVKAYMALGGAMHDAAIVAWAVKGWYDYVRPISAIRFMGQLGQSTDPNLPHYHPAGLPLVPGFIELIDSTDSALAGQNFQHVGKVKILSWKGHQYIQDAATDIAGVDWIRPRWWWPYQRPSFVTPPFAGYVSGHSTYSRAASEVMTLLTGDDFFPGGVGRFVAPKNKFLKFEKGPSDTIVLEWARYYDASDQCSLSRIWGGIHPPADDIPGRKLGHIVGIEAFMMAEALFIGDTNDTAVGKTELPSSVSGIHCFPNPSKDGQINVTIDGSLRGEAQVDVYDALGHQVVRGRWKAHDKGYIYHINLEGKPAGFYQVIVQQGAERFTQKVLLQ